MAVRAVECESEREGGRVDPECRNLTSRYGGGYVHQCVPRDDVRSIAVGYVRDRLVDGELEFDRSRASLASDSQLEGLLSHVDARSPPYRPVAFP